MTGRCAASCGPAIPHAGPVVVRGNRVLRPIRSPRTLPLPRLRRQYRHHFLLETRDTRFPFAVAFDPRINPTLFAIAYFSRSPPGRLDADTSRSNRPSFVSFPPLVLNGISTSLRPRPTHIRCEPIGPFNILIPHKKFSPPNSKTQI